MRPFLVFEATVSQDWLSRMTDHNNRQTRRRIRPRTDPFRWDFTDGSTPTAPHVASMTWRDGLFVNWPVDADALRPHVPDQLTLETRDGDAWLSVLPFVLTKVGLRGAPPFTRTAVAELNVRTYVRYRGDPGLFFFSIDVGSPLIAAIVGRTTRLPVYHAHMLSETRSLSMMTPSTSSEFSMEPPTTFSTLMLSVSTPSSSATA